MKAVLLSGGVGGARFARGLVDVLDPGDVTVIGNVGDDLEVFGLHVSPDLDTLLYTLAGVADEERGWGRAGETWTALETAAALGADTWFRLGDRDLGLHLTRTEALERGQPLSLIMERLARALEVETTILPATDDRLRTWVVTPAGDLPFQEWFVRRAALPDVDGVRFDGGDAAEPAQGVREALDGADVVLIAPSNPYVSIWPILAVERIRRRIAERRVPAVAVSPLIGGRAVKGPADRMLVRLAGGTAPRHVASCYAGLIDVLVIDESDSPEGLDVRPIVTRTLMSDADARRRLAEAALDAAAAVR
jgi:LPPG:FO 2-phospho-L-lactate transferase